MHESGLEYLRCTGCHTARRLDLEALSCNREVDEGFLTCRHCGLVFPIILGIPVMWADNNGGGRHCGLESYLGPRKKTGELMYRRTRNPAMRGYIKSALGAAAPAGDQSDHERHWAGVYLASTRSGFYTAIRREISRLESDTAVEHGCSVGIITRHLARHNRHTFGIDRSFMALLEAKMAAAPPGGRLDYVAADSLRHPFGKNGNGANDGNQRFDTVVALNMIDMVEPGQLLPVLAAQTKRNLVVSSPYDSHRGAASVTHPATPDSLRAGLRRGRLDIPPRFHKPGRIPWTLKIGPRIEVRYLVDLVVAQRRRRRRRGNSNGAGGGGRARSRR